jgi:hypothetical protein
VSWVGEWWRSLSHPLWPHDTLATAGSVLGEVAFLLFPETVWWMLISMGAYRPRIIPRLWLGSSARCVRGPVRACMYASNEKPAWGPAALFICQLRWPGGDAVACPPADMHAYIPIELPPNSSPALSSASEWLKHSSCLPASVIRVCLEYTTSVHKKCNSHFMRNQIVSNLTNL